MPGVPDGHIPKGTKIRPYDVIRPGPHPPPRPDHAPHVPFLAPRAPEREEVFRNVLQTFYSQR